MYQSVMKIKSLPDEVKIFCGHEYTESNLKFCLAYDQNNDHLTKRAAKIKSYVAKVFQPCQLQFLMKNKLIFF